MSRSSLASRCVALVAIAGAAFAVQGCGSAESPAAANAAPPVIDIVRENIVTVTRTEISVGPLISGDLRAQREIGGRKRGADLCE